MHIRIMLNLEKSFFFLRSWSFLETLNNKGVWILLKTILREKRLRKILNFQFLEFENLDISEKLKKSLEAKWMLFSSATYQNFNFFSQFEKNAFLKFHRGVGGRFACLSHFGLCTHTCFSHNVYFGYYQLIQIVSQTAIALHDE